MPTPKLSQDPHRVRDTREHVLEVAIGREVRKFRRQMGLTVADLSAATKLPIGMLSKIENGNTSPSLTTLQTLANAFSVPLIELFRRFEENRDAAYLIAPQIAAFGLQGGSVPILQAAHLCQDQPALPRLEPCLSFKLPGQPRLLVVNPAAELPTSFEIRQLYHLNGLPTVLLP